MRSRVAAVVVIACLGAGGLAGASDVGGGKRKAQAAVQAARCSRAVVEGEVRAGEGFRRSFAGGLDLVLEPIASGWVVRVLPTRGQRPPVDYAEIATPPYRSVSPLLVSTDFSFRAQDAVGWNPRRFRYAADGRAFAAMEVAYRRLTAARQASAADEEALSKEVGVQPEGVLEILDARLAPGTADQTRAAGLVSSHFGTTAHSIEQPTAGGATALGRIGGLRFRVKLELLHGVRPAPGVKIESFPCGRG